MDIDREITTSSDSGDSGSSEDQHPPSTASRLTFYDAFTLLVSLQVGSGVFSSPSQVNNHSPSPGASLIIWAICGAVAWAGAASFAELGAAMPVNGGLQEYLYEMYGSYMAFLASWIWIFATKPSSMAILSIICAKYWTEVFLPANDEEPFWLNKIIATSALAMMIFFNSISTRATSRLANVFLIIKLLTVALLLVCCLVFIVFGFHVGTDTPNRDWITKNWFQYRNEGEDFSFIDWNSASQWSKIGEITMAIYAGLWAYAGWDNANIVAGEMQDAAKELPAAIHTAVPAVIVCFLCANLSYYILIPWNVIGASDTVAETAGQNVLGRSGAVIFALLISVACLGSININVFTSARLTISAVNKGYLPKLLSGHGHSQNGQPQDRQLQDAARDCSLSSKLLSLFGEGPFWQTPIKAMLFNGCLTIVYILVGTFSALVTFIGIAEYVFFFFAVLGLLHMRVKQPHLHRPYKAFIGIPLSFTLISLVLVVRGILAAPVQGIAIALLLLSGTIWHFRESDTFDILRRRVRYQPVPA